MIVYELNIQTDDELITNIVELANKQKLGQYIKRILTEGLSQLEKDGKSGKCIPGHEIKNIKWRIYNVENLQFTPRVAEYL